MKLVSVLLSILLYFVLSSQVFAYSEYPFQRASDGQINEAMQKIVPVRYLRGHPFYYLISVKEILTRFFQPSSAKKAEFDLTLSGKKIKEAYLLLDRGYVDDSAKTLNSYKRRVDSMVGELEHARTQNQEVRVIVDEIAEGLRLHETMFFAINQKWKGVDDSAVFDVNFESAVAAHANVVLAIDNVKPGVKDRFTTVGKYEEKEATPEPSPIESPFIEATASVRPKRIIL